MAGAVSAGCYTAGVMDYLFEILDLWERAKDGKIPDIPQSLIPQYNVVIDVMGGTSAGGMATMMSAIYALEGDINPVKEVPVDPLASQNILYDNWVHMVDKKGRKPKSFERIWATDDLSGPQASVKSLFNSSFIDEIADNLLNIAGSKNLEDQVANLPPYISKDLELILSHTLIRGVPLEVHFSSAIGSERKDAPSHTSFEHFLVSHFKLNQGKAVAQQDGYLWLNPYEEEHSEKIKLSSKSTGAFPLGLQFRQFDQKQFSNAYYESVIKKILLGDFSLSDSSVLEDLELTLGKAFESLTIDGGAMNNEPYREVYSILKRRSSESDSFVDHALIMIDPFPDIYREKEEDNIEADLVDVVPKIIKTLWNQAKVKRRETIEQFAQKGTHSQIFPKLNYKEGKDLKSKDYPIVSASFEAFGGLLDINFRKHDFFLGRNNARNFFRYFFSLPYYENNPEKNHPIHRSWTKESVERYKIEKDKICYLPIIPDLNIAVNKLSWAGEEWDKYDIAAQPLYDPRNLFQLEDIIRNRFVRLLSVLRQRSFTKSEDMGPLTEAWLSQKNRRSRLRRIQAKAGQIFGRPLHKWGTKQAVKWGINKLSSNLTEGIISYILSDLERKGLLLPHKSKEEEKG